MCWMEGLGKVVARPFESHIGFSMSFPVFFQYGGFKWFFLMNRLFFSYICIFCFHITEQLNESFYYRN